MRRLIRTVLLILCLSGVAPLRAQINTDQVMQIGRNALYFEDYVLSIQYFNQVISAKPYLAQPYFYRALAKFNLDDLQGAENDATAAIERNPFITDAYELRGITRQNLGRTQEAIADYEEALRQLPENQSILFNKALAEESLGHYDKAQATYAEILRAHPSYDAGYIGRAKLELARGDTISAVADLDKAIELNPNAVNAYILRADVAIGNGEDYSSALKDMDRAVRLLPRQSGLYVNRAFLRYKLDDYFGAMADYDYAIQLDPINTVALFNRSLLRMEVRDFNNAVSDLNQVLKLYPTDYRAIYNRAIALRELRDYRGALADINTLIDAFPDLAAAYYLRADIKHSMGDRTATGDRDHSLALARQRVKRDGKNPSAEEVFGRPSGTADADGSESQEVVAARFSQLRTLDDNATSEPSSNNPGIRGRVQDRNVAIQPEPIFTATYYCSPTELRPTGEYLRQIDAVNATNALNYLLQVTNHEAMLNDSEEIERHFRSVDYYNSYISTHQPRAIDYFGRGMNRMTLRDYAAAATDFRKSLELAPDFALAQFMTGVALYRELQSEHAVAEGAVQGKDMPAESQSDRHMATMARYRQVIEAFNKALELAPDMALALYNEACVFIEMNDYTSALSALNKAIELNPRLGEAYYNRGYVHFTLGDRAAGAADLSRAGQLGVAPSYNLLKRMTR